MHPTVFAGEVAIAVHVLGEDGRPIDMRCQQAVAELVCVEMLGEFRHMS
jgi:hypothetical protein